MLKMSDVCGNFFSTVLSMFMDPFLFCCMYFNVLNLMFYLNLNSVTQQLIAYITSHFQVPFLLSSVSLELLVDLLGQSRGPAFGS